VVETGQKSLELGVYPQAVIASFSLRGSASYESSFISDGLPPLVLLMPPRVLPC